MANLIEESKTIGTIKAKLYYKDGKIESKMFKNALLDKGRGILANFLAKNIKQPDLHIHNMLFGDGGFDYKEAKVKGVTANRNNLFGITRAKKEVHANIDSSKPNLVTFSSIVTYEEANGYSLNEMALQFSDGNLFSMATFPDIGKTDQLQIEWDWEVLFV